MTRAVATFSLLGKKTRGIQAMLGVLLLAGGYFGYRIASDFNAEMERATGLGKMAVVLIPVVTPLLVLILLFFPYRYDVTDDGVTVRSVLTKRSVAFAEVESVILEAVPNQKVPSERIVLSGGGKKLYVAAALTDRYEELRDRVLESVPSETVRDTRGARGIG